MFFQFKPQFKKHHIMKWQKKFLEIPNIEEITYVLLKQILLYLPFQKSLEEI